MIGDQQAVFISGSDLFKERTARPFKRLLEANGILGVIVSDAPLLDKTWTPEEKVDGYLKLSDAVVVLATPDETTSAGEVHTRPNIADEIGRARTMEHLRDRICVLKERSVRLQSNVNPAYEALDADAPKPAFAIALRQLRAWGFEIADPPVTPEAPAPPSPAHASVLQLIEGLPVEDIQPASDRVAAELRRRSKREQIRLVADISDFIASEPDWEKRSVASHLLEAISIVDTALVSTDLIDDLSRHPDSLVRSSAAVMLCERALTAPGLVPLDIVGRLAAQDADESPVAAWYIYTAARNCLKRLAMVRPETWHFVRQLADSKFRDAREDAAVIAMEIAKRRPAAVPLTLVKQLAADADPHIARLANEALALSADVTEDDRANAYSPFGVY